MDQITRDFLEFEKEKALFEREYCGFSYWQGIRLEIGRGIEGIQKIPVTTEVVTRKKRNLIAPCRAFLKDIRNYFCLKKCDILYFDQGLEGAYRNINGEMRDVYLDYFGYEDIYRFERCYYITGKKKNAERFGIGTALILPYKLMFRIRKRMNPEKNIDRKEEEFLRNLCNDINIKYKKNISSDILVQNIQYNRELYYAYEKFYKLILKRTHPKTVILQCHYSTILFPLYRIAKKLSVPVIELQHGTVANHLAYLYHEISERGKDLPDYLFTYGHFWEEQMHLPEGMQTITVGNPFLEAMKENNKDGISDEKTIVFYSGSFSSDGKELEKLAVRFCEKYADEGYKIYFKFHPGEAVSWKENYKLLRECKEIHIVEPEMDVYRLFAMARHHICVHSTVIYEAVNFNVRRYVYSMEGMAEATAEVQQLLIEKGIAQRVCDERELRELIMNKVDEDFDVADEIWKSGAKENGQKALREIMREERYR